MCGDLCRYRRRRRSTGVGGNAMIPSQWIDPAIPSQWIDPAIPSQWVDPSIPSQWIDAANS